MKIRKLFAAGAIVLAAATGASATTVSLTEGSWFLFDVVDPTFGLGNSGLEWVDLFDGSKLSFTFSLAAGQVGYLTVADGGFAGDEFSVFSNGVALASTSSAVDSYPNSVGLDFDVALTDNRFSRGSYAFTAGTYTVTGALSRSALDDTGAALNATVGALRLQIPEPNSLLLLLAAGGAMALTGRRRAG